MAKKVTYIKEFIFNKAQYFISDENNNTILLKINYRENSYEAKLDAVPEALAKEVTDVARALLRKKHGVNRAKYVRK